MDKIRCAECGDEHDLSELEPSFLRPDALLAVPADERAERTLDGKDACALREADGSGARYFLRVLLPVPVRGDPSPCRWGIWAEVSERDYRRAGDRWDDPAQGDEPPFRSTLANAVPGYTSTLGLPGRVQLTGADTVPEFTFDAGVAHPFAAEQREGVYPERVLEWLGPWLHH